jgi:CspA family cold shock protein
MKGIFTLSLVSFLIACGGEDDEQNFSMNNGGKADGETCAGKLGNISGTVKFYNGTKNFGFIAGDDGTDYFVHASGLVEGVEIIEGDKVCFSVVAGDRGPQAEKVEKI